jgi:hypothetical protein
MTAEQFNSEFASDVMPLYIESARTYAQLAAGALGLTIVFREKVLGLEPGRGINALLVSCWVGFLGAIGASAYYQWVAVRLIEYSKRYLAGLAGDEEQYFPLTVSWLWPGRAYGVMVALFFAGGVFLVAASALQLGTRRPGASGVAADRTEASSTGTGEGSIGTGTSV